MKRTAMYVLVSTIAWFGCGISEPRPPERQAAADVRPSATPAIANQVRMFCSDVGGTCRKSACRTNEVLSTRFQCGTDAACCVPR